MPTYTTLKIKNDIAEKFRSFSRSTAMNQSELLDLMITFFIRNKISPKEDLGPNMETLEATMKKRIGSVIAIIRAIEKSQTKPTFTMLQLLFHSTENKQPTRVEKTISARVETPLSQNTIQNSPAFDDINLILDHISVSRTSFGTSYFRLNLTSSEINRLKSIYKIKS